MKVNEFTQQYIDERSAHSLPSRDILSLSDCSYEYNYDCALLGDPNLLIYLKTNKLDENVFAKEANRLEGISVKTFTLMDNRILYSMKIDFDEQKEIYNDDEIVDGQEIVFELAVVDISNRTIEYLLALQQDNNANSSIISGFLNITEEK